MPGVRFKYLILLSFLFASCSTWKPRYHTVEKGDSLWRVAKRYGIPGKLLMKYNHRLAKRTLQPGDKVYIPYEELSHWPTNRELASVKGAGGGSFLWPVRAPISSGFGKRRGRMHDGIDLAAKTGTPVRSSRGGTVTYSGNRIRGYGNLIILRHASGFSTVYAHLSRRSVKTGQRVARGQLIGKVGNTGRSTNPHLHFEIRKNRVARNPLLYLQGRYAANILNRANE